MISLLRPTLQVKIEESVLHIYKTDLNNHLSRCIRISPAFCPLFEMFFFGYFM